MGHTGAILSGDCLGNEGGGWVYEEGLLELDNGRCALGAQLIVVKLVLGLVVCGHAVWVSIYLLLPPTCCAGAGIALWVGTCIREGCECK
jgi:hypothetical protein